MTEYTYKPTRYNFPGLTTKLSRIQWVGLYLWVPMVLLLVYYLPAQVKVNFLVLSIQHPTLLAMLTTTFTHSLASHLSTNLAYYLIAVSAIIFMETNFSRFKYTIVVIFGLIPVLASSAALIYFSNSGATQVLGFSAVISGLIGYAVYLLIERMYLVTPKVTKALLTWGIIATMIVISLAISLSLVYTYQPGHISNGVGHLVGYVLGILLVYLLN